MCAATNSAQKILQRPKLHRIKKSDGFEAVLPGFVEENTIKKIVDFEIRQDDVIIATYAKAG